MANYQPNGQVFFSAISLVTAAPVCRVGTRRVEDGEEYVYFLNNTGSSVTQGALMIKSLNSVTRSSTVSADLAYCGVKHAAVPAAEYAWGLTRGEMIALSGAVAAGELINIGTDGAIKTAITGSFATGPIVGKVLSAGGANAGARILLRADG